MFCGAWMASISRLCLNMRCVSDLFHCKQLRSACFFSSPEAVGTINPTDYSAPLLLDCTFTISRGCQQWGPDESNIHGISFTLLPLSHAPPPLCQATVWWEGLLTLATPIDRRFCKDEPQQPTNAPPLPPSFTPRKVTKVERLKTCCRGSTVKNQCSYYRRIIISGFCCGFLAKV